MTANKFISLQTDEATSRSANILMDAFVSLVFGAETDDEEEKQPKVRKVSKRS